MEIKLPRPNTGLKIQTAFDNAVLALKKEKIEIVFAETTRWPKQRIKVIYSIETTTNRMSRRTDKMDSMVEAPETSHKFTSVEQHKGWFGQPYYKINFFYPSDIGPIGINLYLRLRPLYHKEIYETIELECIGHFGKDIEKFPPSFAMLEKYISQIDKVISVFYNELQPKAA